MDLHSSFLANNVAQRDWRLYKIKTHGPIIRYFLLMRDNPIQTATAFDSHSDSEDDSQSTSVDHNSSFITRRKSSPQIPKEALGCDYSNNKMTINAKPRKKLWLRIMVFLVFFLCLAVFLVPKERLFGLDLEGEFFHQEIGSLKQ